MAARKPRKPKTVSESAFMSAKWDELCKGRHFKAEDIPALTLLVQWYAVIERCMNDMDVGEGLPQIAYENKMGDIKPVPMISVMKQASAEIRQLNKQLGINDEAEPEAPKSGGVNVLKLVTENRKKRAAH